ncbi:Translation initiation factor IF-2, mitochondrial [Smittium mucronatum]|uniref:Translation initiation factor IF-2, mitochondrial n=1 Tax=Smittium mucronatum TaxID=133383 RepID=A0A1R0GUU1_9FUNG|nr:Translation initiation factor IF-2, mitochondrial [Smittium mucronatum]
MSSLQILHLSLKSSNIPVMSFQFLSLLKSKSININSQPNLSLKKNINSPRFVSNLRRIRTDFSISKNDILSSYPTLPIFSKKPLINNIHPYYSSKNSSLFQSFDSIQLLRKNYSTYSPNTHSSEETEDYSSIIDFPNHSAPERTIKFASEADLNDLAFKKKGLKRRLSKIKNNAPIPGRKINIPLSISVDSLAKLIGVKQVLTNEEACKVAKAFKLIPLSKEDKEQDVFPRKTSDKIESYPVRPPIVTIMGHVDHGKTTLLDTLRKSNIVNGEFGGITQHIGAFSVQMNDGSTITFLDTPGHSAFSAMRQRGANVTDIAVIVVAADDGVMPQTKEAIRHALDADVPIIIAITKCDKHGSDPEKVKRQLLESGIHVEDLGGDIQAVEISSTKGTGLDLLTENISALAELLELHAEDDIPIEATVIESKVAKGKGNEASVVILRGCLKLGDVIVSGQAWSKVRSITDEFGNKLKKVGPGHPALVTGWKDLPVGGELVLGVDNESIAKRVCSYREKISKEMEAANDIEAYNQMRMEVNDKKDAEKLIKKRVIRKGDKIFKQAIGSTQISGETTTSKEPEIKTLHIILKADVTGTLEAILESISNLPNTKVVAEVIDSGVGGVTDGDLQLASGTKDAIIVTFNVKNDRQIETMAKRSKVEIFKTNVIYKLVDIVKEQMLAIMDPVYEDFVEGEARVQQIFPINIEKHVIQNIAGSRVVSGNIEKHGLVKVIRNGNVVCDSTINTLKQLKKDVAKVTKGMDCGIGILGFDEIQNDDIIQTYKKKPVEQTID